MDLKSISRAWHDYFEYGNAHPALHWDEPYHLSDAEREAIRASIQQFQLGEGSGGTRLLRRGWDHGRDTSDPYYAAALSLFVREEQRHSGYLARFMERERIPLVPAHWIDGVFRWLRNLAGLELSVRVLLTAEVIAMPYYASLSRATASPLLQQICAVILADEREHLNYQASNLARLARGRGEATRRLIDTLHCGFLSGTALVVWMMHRGFFLAAGCRFSGMLAEVLGHWNTIADRCRARVVPNTIPAVNGLHSCVK